MATSGVPETCEFCRIIDEGTELLWESDYVAVRPGRPHRKGHTQVIFRRHEEDLTDLSPCERDAFFDDMIYVAQVVERVMKPEVLNYQLLGNWVPHLHWHIYPRYRTDPDFGDPPVIPLKGEPFEEQWPSEGEVDALRRQLAAGKLMHCPACNRSRRSS